MNKITLEVSNENLETLLTILDNLKDGLILNLETNSKVKPKMSSYKPKINTVVYEQDSGVNDKSGKYSATAYKQRLKKK